MPRTLAATLLALACGGCISSMKNGDLAALRPESDPAQTRVGQVYLIRGLIGLFSVGIDRLSQQINAAGITAHVYQDTQYQQMATALIAHYAGQPRREPLCLVGHSAGAEDVITIARKLGEHGIDVDLLVCLDATNPRPVPANVKRCVNYYQSSLMDHLPVLRGLPLQPGPDFHGELANLNVRREHPELLEWDTNHFNIDKDEKIHADILNRLNALCPTRPQWLAMQKGPTTTVSALK